MGLVLFDLKGGCGSTFRVVDFALMTAFLSVDSPQLQGPKFDQNHGSGPHGALKGRSWPTLRMLFLIFAISGEQLFLNVADDSAQTLSVLGNMGNAFDDCCLSFVQKCRRSPQNTPILGSNFEKITGMQPYRNHTKSVN